MCSYLTVGVAGTQSAALETALLALRLEVSRDVNPQVASLFAPGEVLFLVTRGGCSCDLVPLKADSPRDEKRRRRGMSGSKKPNQVSDTLFAALKAHVPLRLFFHEVEGDQLTAPLQEGATLTGLS